MKQLLILSGKGGTGKTTVASAFIKLLNANYYADCDVEAPNLDITSTPNTTPKTEDYYGLQIARIDYKTCVSCMKCVEKCKFDAIKIIDGKPVISEFACEGCGVCAYICPVHAIKMEDCVNGKTLTYDASPRFATAKLKMGSGASGKLVSKVKENLKKGIETDDVAIIDGAPGLGCPVIASMSGVDMSLIVTEPTISGISDLERIVEAAAYFKVKCAVCINKYDINLENTDKIKEYCKDLGINVIGTIPFDQKVNIAINEGKSIVDIDCIAGEAVKSIFKDTIKILNEEDK